MSSPPSQQQRPFSLHQLLTELTFGGYAVTISKLITGPIDRIQLILQLDRIQVERKRTRSMMNVFKDIEHREGILGLWKGTGLSILRSFPTNIWPEFLKDIVKALFGDYDTETDYWKHLISVVLSGAVGGALSLALVYPLDVVRIRISEDIGNLHFSGAIACCKQILKEDGFFGLYSGYLSAVASIAVHRAVYFCFHDLVKKVLFRNSSGSDQPPSLFGRLYATMISQAASAVAYPFVVVRTNMIRQAGNKVKQFTGYMNCFQKVYKRRGIMGFYAGLEYSTVNSVVGALILVTYDILLQKLLSKLRARQASQPPPPQPPN